MRTKSFTQISGTEDGWSWTVRLAVNEDGTFQNIGQSFRMRNEKERREKNRKKNVFRIKDRMWVVRNIPSSIWWYMEVHHDWEDGGRMYLLTKGEHILRHRKEKL